jgi:hypothetical protein
VPSHKCGDSPQPRQATICWPLQLAGEVDIYLVCFMGPSYLQAISVRLGCRKCETVCFLDSSLNGVCVLFSVRFRHPGATNRGNRNPRLHVKNGQTGLSGPVLGGTRSSGPLLGGTCSSGPVLGGTRLSGPLHQVGLSIPLRRARQACPSEFVRDLIHKYGTRPDRSR